MTLSFLILVHKALLDPTLARLSNLIVFHFLAVLA